jgi:TonB family protein
MILNVVLAVSVFLAPPQPAQATAAGDKPPAAPDCRQLLSGVVAPAVNQLCQAEAALHIGNAAAEGSDERRQHLTSAADQFSRAATVLRDPDLKIYAIDAITRIYDAAHLNEPRRIEQALRELIPLMPRDSSPLRRLATVQEEEGNLEAAESSLLSARQQLPDDVEVYRELSKFYGRRAAALAPADAGDARTPEEPEPGQPDEEGYYRMDGTTQAPKKLEVTTPEYPRDARAAGIEGTVVIEVKIDEFGAVTDAKILKSVPMLDDAALRAVRLWRFTPTMIDGRAVPAKMTVRIPFAPG